ncbi:serine/threonine-protein phosphatase [Rodentibacter rarus]|uniref:metallophosphoesterase n=1 Tax=Rodentibacter rarus TaxID=1908260 RepID=UPI0009855341|nr:metallophosphoesterase [Rodentibacter rarus]OOF39875.1 serine/threonine-protein phosphatase [Rodentibacter rarus]
MSNIYQKIDVSQYKNIYVVGDIHGCYDLLMEELNLTRFDNTTDLLISVGDLIDRGSQNLECLNLVKQPWFKAVRGNHDQMAIDGLVDNNFDMLSCWIMNGGNWFFKLTDEDKAQALDLFKECKKLPLIIELAMPNGKKVIVAHADYPDNYYEFDKAVSSKDVLWNRDRIENNSEMMIDGADMFIFGHTPVREPLKLGNRFYIDTGAVFNGNLTLVKLV